MEKKFLHKVQDENQEFALWLCVRIASINVYTPAKTIRSYANHLVGYITDDRGVSCSLPKPDQKQTPGKCQVCDGHGPLV